MCSDFLLLRLELEPTNSPIQPMKSDQNSGSCKNVSTSALVLNGRAALTSPLKQTAFKICNYSPGEGLGLSTGHSMPETSARWNASQKFAQTSIAEHCICSSKRLSKAARAVRIAAKPSRVSCVVSAHRVSSLMMVHGINSLTAATRLIVFSDNILRTSLRAAVGTAFHWREMPCTSSTRAAVQGLASGPLSL